MVNFFAKIHIFLFPRRRFCDIIKEDYTRVKNRAGFHSLLIIARRDGFCNTFSEISSISASDTNHRGPNGEKMLKKTKGWTK
ncbi:MAG: hypothetical protein II557_10700, partial [Clostridia bacterium]|nr:hypothetical protein [Clostridia bacterium]